MDYHHFNSSPKMKNQNLKRPKKKGTIFFFGAKFRQNVKNEK